MPVPNPDCSYLQLVLLEMEVAGAGGLMQEGSGPATLLQLEQQLQVKL